MRHTDEHGTVYETADEKTALLRVVRRQARGERFKAAALVVLAGVLAYMLVEAVDVANLLFATASNRSRRAARVEAIPGPCNEWGDEPYAIEGCDCTFCAAARDAVLNPPPVPEAPPVPAPDVA